jgi:hypothetical protein
LKASHSATKRAPFWLAGDVEGAGQRERLVGDDADAAAADRDEGGDEVRGPATPQLEHLAVVHDRPARRPRTS